MAYVVMDQLSEDQFVCSICLYLLKDPVTTPCGHSFCKVCINDCWDQEYQRGVYGCPQCRETFTPRPVLHRNTMLTEVVEKLQKAKLHDAPASPANSKSEEVPCDFCSENSGLAVKSCLTCMASFCETHLKPHNDVPVLKKHKLVEATAHLEEKICSKHNELLKIYCQSCQSNICTLCLLDKHRGHSAVSTEAENPGVQMELKEEQSSLKIQEKQKQVQELRQTILSIKQRSLRAADESEMIFTEIISLLENKCRQVIQLIQDQETEELWRAERLLQQAEQKITEFRKSTEFPSSQSQTQFQSLPFVSPNFANSKLHTFDGFMKSLGDLKKHVEMFCKQELNEIPSHAAEREQGVGGSSQKPSALKFPEFKKLKSTPPKVTVARELSSSDPTSREDFLQFTVARELSSAEPTSREDFLQYYTSLTLDPNTVHPQIILSENNRVGTWTKTPQSYPDVAERFDSTYQVLSKERLCGRSYWEVEWMERVSIAVSYKGILRKKGFNQGKLGGNNQSWSLICSSYILPSFFHKNISSNLDVPISYRIGVYVDCDAGVLAFYGITDTMNLIHKVQTQFTQTLYAGFNISGGSVRICDLPQISTRF